jgi:branched-chain amino acid transport system permease protein
MLLHVHGSAVTALIGAALAGGVTAGVVGWFAIRQSGVYFVLLTLAFAQMFYVLAYTLTNVTGGDNGLLNIPRPDIELFRLTLLKMDSLWHYYTFVAAVFLLVFFVVQRIAASILGQTLRAIRDNEGRALAIGYDIKVFKTVAFVVSGIVTGLAGGLHALLMGIAPLSNIEYHMSETILVITVIGGTGNLFASVLGAVLYVLAADWLSALWPRWLMLLGFLLIAVTLYMQDGLWGLAQRVLVQLRRRVGESAVPVAKGEPPQ